MSNYKMARYPKTVLALSCYKSIYISKLTKLKLRLQKRFKKMSMIPGRKNKFKTLILTKEGLQLKI